jgi:aspartate aminotransferase-like enzyme
MPPREFLMIPGPTPVPDAVLQAIAQHPIGHRTADFSKMLRSAVDSLNWLGESGNDVLVLTSSGTGAMDAAIANTVSAGDRVLSLVQGVFSERWAKIAEAYGANVERLVVEPGQAIDPQTLSAKLEADKEKSIKAVTITHNETSTGVINNLERLASIVKSHGALSIVDAVTSFGACPLPIDKWGVDVLVTGSQKALMLPPGLAFVFVSKRAWEAHSRCKNPRFYFDFGKYKKSLEANTTPFTPNVSLVAGLQVSLDLIREEGLQAVHSRHERLKSALRAGLTAMGLQLFVSAENASPTITSILPPPHISVDAIRKGLKERYRILVADGQDSLKGKIFRIGHMGYVFDRDVLMTLASLECVLTDLGYACPPGKAIAEASAVLNLLASAV